jgi:hypothetical protein
MRKFLEIAIPSLKKAYEKGSVPKVKIQMNNNTYGKSLPLRGRWHAEGVTDEGYKGVSKSNVYRQ